MPKSVYFSFFFFNTMKLNHSDQKVVVNSRSYTCWKVPDEGYNNKAAAQKAEKNSVPQQTNPHGEPVHLTTNTTNKIWLRNHLCLRLKKSTNKHKVTGLQVGFPGSGTRTTTATAWRTWRQRATGITGARESNGHLGSYNQSADDPWSL